MEQRFRYTEKDRKDWLANPVHEAPLERLPVMFCSPTMELGVDISALNTVYLRNVPPTPPTTPSAAAGQALGPAGAGDHLPRCAQPARSMVFHHATEMVHGIVKPPTLDPANRDLVESHLHAVWMAAAQVQLSTPALPRLLDLEQPDKPLQPALREKLAAPEVTARALQHPGFHGPARPVLAGSSWFSAEQIDATVRRAADDFSAAFERWRAGGRHPQTDGHGRPGGQSYTTSHAEKQNAQRRYGDAARQYAVLLKSGNGQNSDFYTYRYLASQGFLPGY